MVIHSLSLFSDMLPLKFYKVRANTLACDSELVWGFCSSFVKHNLSPHFLLFYSLASCLTLSSLSPWLTHLDIIYCPDILDPQILPFLLDFAFLGNNSIGTIPTSLLALVLGKLEFPAFYRWLF